MPQYLEQFLHRRNVKLRVRKLKEKFWMKTPEKMTFAISKDASPILLNFAFRRFEIALNIEASMRISFRIIERVVNWESEI